MKKLSIALMIATISFSSAFAEESNLSSNASKVVHEVAKQHAQMEDSIAFYKVEISKIREQIAELKENTDLEFVLTTRKAALISGAVALFVGVKVAGKVNERAIFDMVKGYTGQYQGMTSKVANRISTAAGATMYAGLASLAAGAIAHGVVRFNHEEYVQLDNQLEDMEDILEEKEDELQEKRELLGLE